MQMTTSVDGSSSHLHEEWQEGDEAVVLHNVHDGRVQPPVPWWLLLFLVTHTNILVQ